MADGWASDSGHWYTADGEPCYEVKGKNGKMRNTTLRDARVMNLYPSVTTIIKEAAAPGLERWKRDQILLAALTTSQRVGEDERSWLARIQADSYEQTRRAAERGGAIHGAVERHFRGETPVEDWHWDWVQVVKREIRKHCGDANWLTERSFACPIGYGGRLDLHCFDWLLDIKTKDGIEDATPYDENVMQLAAYRKGMRITNARCGILFIDRLSPTTKLCIIEEGELVRGWHMFQHLHSYWQHKTGYMPNATIGGGVAEAVRAQ